MKELFKRLNPITSQIAFIKGDLANIVTEFLKWQEPLISEFNNSLKATQINDNLENTLMQLCPLTTTERRRYLFIPVKNNWVAMFDNGHTGTDRTAPKILGKRLHSKHLYISYDLNTEETLFDYYDLIGDNIELIRSISVIRESKWEFEEYGTPFSFEKIIDYKNRQIKKRFNIETLVEYLNELGISIFTEDFYSSQDSILVEKIGPKFENTKELSLKEAQNFFS